jgi:hypothetical protein
MMRMLLEDFEKKREEGIIYPDNPKEFRITESEFCFLFCEITILFSKIPVCPLQAHRSRWQGPTGLCTGVISVHWLSVS